MNVPAPHAAASNRPCPGPAGIAPPSPRNAEADPPANPRPPLSQAQSTGGLVLIVALIVLWLIFGRGAVHIIDQIARQVAG